MELGEKALLIHSIIKALGFVSRPNGPQSTADEKPAVLQATCRPVGICCGGESTPAYIQPESEASTCSAAAAAAAAAAVYTVELHLNAAVHLYCCRLDCCPQYRIEMLCQELDNKTGSTVARLRRSSNPVLRSRPTL